jgi:ATP-dependent Clp protease adaptor protein ClpS
MMATGTKLPPELEVLAESEIRSDRPWLCIAWDDPVNLMNYVTKVFMMVFGYPRYKATELMLKVHTEGKAVVSSGTREEMERDVAKLHEYGLWATIQRDDE